MIWFAASVFIVVVSTFALWLWLLRQGVKLLFIWIGTPGYLEYAYLQWCRNKGQRPNRGIIAFRAVMIINVIIAAIFFIAVA